MNNRVLALLVLLLALGLFFGYVSPTWYGPIAETKAAIESDDKALDAAREYTARQNELAAERDAIDPASLARLKILLPDAVDNVGLILALNALAARSDLSLTNIDVSANTASASGDGYSTGSVSPVNSIDLSLTATGSYRAFHAFLDGVEMSQRLLDVRDVTIASAPTGRYAYKMTIRLYWLR